MVYYYAPIYFQTSSDNEEKVTSLYSSREEPKHIVSVILLGWTNEGIMRLYREREKIGEIPTGASNVQLPHEIEIDLDLPEGQEFILTLQNRTSGSNAMVIGYIKYLIK